MRRTFPRLASCGVLAALFIPLLPTQLLAQKHIGGCGGGTGCVHNAVSSDAANQRFPGCAIQLGGSIADLNHLDGVYEVIRETAIQHEDGTACGCGEWIWVFNNVPHGQRYLRFGGYSDHNTYKLIYRFCDTQGDKTCPSQANPTNCPWDGYNSVGTIGPGAIGDSLTTVSLGNDLYDGGNVCVLLQLCGPLSGCTNSSCATADQVHMDILMLAPDPNCFP